MTALSPSVEDYLKAIYALSEGGEAATTSAIAERLALTPAAVTEMVKKLAEAGHLEHAPYRGARLTVTGRRAALGILRRHRILETYLITKLGYDWATVHEEAERLEHAASEVIVERMAAALGGPRYDPHGAPIPTADGRIEEVPSPRLEDVRVGGRARIAYVAGADPDRLRYLETLGLVPGAEVVMVARAPYGGPITVRLAGVRAGERAIGPELAATIRVSAAT